jgi:hypothetical protein
MKYEDLIDNPLAEVKRLYSLMNTEISQEVTQFLSDHTAKARSVRYWDTGRVFSQIYAAVTLSIMEHSEGRISSQITGKHNWGWRESGK